MRPPVCTARWLWPRHRAHLPGESSGRGDGAPTPRSDPCRDASADRRCTMVLAADYPLLNLMWTFFILFGLVVYFWVLITVFADLFRRRDVSGWAKAGWTVFVLVLPLAGALVYLISQGRTMAD